MNTRSAQAKQASSSAVLEPSRDGTPTPPPPIQADTSPCAAGADAAQVPAEDLQPAGCAAAAPVTMTTDQLLLLIDRLSRSEPDLGGVGSYALNGARSDKQIDLATAGSAPGSIGLQAITYLKADEGSGVEGTLVFTQLVPSGPVTIEGNVTGLSAGLHGLHVHQSGAVKDDCKAIGPHFVAFYGRHGGPRDHVRHVGDLGNIKAEEGATLNVKIFDNVISLTGPRSIVGRSIAISKSEDDYGRASTEDSALTGTSGPAVACGVIGYLN